MEVRCVYSGWTDWRYYHDHRRDNCDYLAAYYCLHHRNLSHHNRDTRHYSSIVRPEFNKHKGRALALPFLVLMRNIYQLMHTVMGRLNFQLAAAKTIAIQGTDPHMSRD